ncbi:MAG TPA: response regulator transcription factor [Petrotogaceae bacterium]|nr:response regulator transcription factor [Petrotogaceae bacterium]HNV06115.1 response regulator transcription factor [Petrotogaceae bacterium]
MIGIYKIFIVEDNLKAIKELEILLKRYGFEIICAKDFSNIPLQVQNVKPHLILLDINLPQYDGFFICQNIRAVSKIPIIIVTARDSDVDTIMGIRLGADDYIKKPYSPEILVVKVQAVLRRVYEMASADESCMKYKGLFFDLKDYSLRYEDKAVELTKNEVKILFLLMNKAGSIVTRDELIYELWNNDEFIDDNTLTVNITRLRKKFESLDSSVIIETKKGVGYILK